MTNELQQVLQSSMWDMFFTIAKYMLIAVIISLPFIWINEKLKKKEREKKARAQDERTKNAIKKALQEHEREKN